MFPWALATGTAALLMIRTGVFAHWLGWFGVPVTVLMLISPLGLGLKSGAFAAGGAVSFIALFAGMTFLLLTAILMLRRSPAVRAMPAAALA
jgi:hypothetical protein